MMILELTLKSRDRRATHRLEILTGSGRLREWPPDETARIVAESCEVAVSAVADDKPLTCSPEMSSL
jgi:transposase